MHLHYLAEEMTLANQGAKVSHLGPWRPLPHEEAALAAKKILIRHMMLDLGVKRPLCSVHGLRTLARDMIEEPGDISIPFSIVCTCNHAVWL